MEFNFNFEGAARYLADISYMDGIEEGKYRNSTGGRVCKKLSIAFANKEEADFITLDLNEKERLWLIRRIYPLKSNGVFKKFAIQASKSLKIVHR